MIAIPRKTTRSDAARQSYLPLSEHLWCYEKCILLNVNKKCQNYFRPYNSSPSLSARTRPPELLRTLDLYITSRLSRLRRERECLRGLAAGHTTPLASRVQHLSLLKQLAGGAHYMSHQVGNYIFRTTVSFMPLLRRNLSVVLAGI